MRHVRLARRVVAAAGLFGALTAFPWSPPREAGVDLVVAGDGTGDFRTVQAALDALPATAFRTRVVLVRSGVYREKVFVTKSRLAIVGEDRDGTRLEHAELRRDWRKTHPDDWGAAVVNVGDDVTDLVLANLTIVNEYGRGTGDRDHQFAIRSGGASTRIALLHANVRAEGGDTVSLWNADFGQTYYASCAFEGWVDFVCPRGTAYVRDSVFRAHSPTAAIWHDGSRDPEHKLVIRGARFEGDPGFALGRHNRDGQFFLLDSSFSEAMADRPIHGPSAPESYRWPTRTYFSGCRRDGGDYAWMRDNLDAAAFRPRSDEVTPEWTFCGQWDPEASVEGLLPFAALPRPHDRARDVPPFGTRLRWAGARGATSYDVRFGEGPNPPVVARGVGTSFDTGPLRANGSFSWRVDAVRPGGTVAGPTWTFDTASRPARVALAGDSTVTAEQGWGDGFAARLGSGVEVLNRARGGRSSKSYRTEGLWSGVLEERPDWVLIQFGHNDAPGKGPERETDPRTTFRENLSRMVDEARAAGIRPVLLTPLTRRYVDDAGCVRSDLLAYADGAKAVARERRVPLVDLHARSIEVLERTSRADLGALGTLKPDGTPDRTHLSPAGSALFGGLVADELAKAVPALAPAIRRPRS